MDFNSFWTWFKSKPIWLRAVISVLLAALAVFGSLCITSCGLTRATVTNRADGTTTSISITTSNPTSVNASPNVDLKVTPDGVSM